MATLKEAKIGSTVTVKKLNGTGAVKRRIMDMGITKGVEVHVRKVAPLGDPIEVTVRGYDWFEPVRALKRVVLPQLGLPARAILISIQFDPFRISAL